MALWKYFNNSIDKHASSLSKGVFFYSIVEHATRWCEVPQAKGGDMPYTFTVSPEDAVCAIPGEEALLMPCEPSALRIVPWILSGVSRMQEAQEVAARILAFSQATGAWVGVSWGSVMRVCAEDFALKEEYPEDAPISGIYTFEDYIDDGLMWLRDEGLIRIEDMREDGQDFMIFPTPALVERAWSAQQGRG